MLGPLIAHIFTSVQRKGAAAWAESVSTSTVSAASAGAPSAIALSGTASPGHRQQRGTVALWRHLQGDAALPRIRTSAALTGTVSRRPSTALWVGQSAVLISTASAVPSGMPSATALTNTAISTGQDVLRQTVLSTMLLSLPHPLNRRHPQSPRVHGGAPSHPPGAIVNYHMFMDMLRSTNTCADLFMNAFIDIANLSMSVQEEGRI